jgi:hypothetical protein
MNITISTSHANALVLDLMTNDDTFASEKAEVYLCVKIRSDKQICFGATRASKTEWEVNIEKDDLKAGFYQFYVLVLYEGYYFKVIEDGVLNVIDRIVDANLKLKEDLKEKEPSSNEVRKQIKEEEPKVVHQTQPTSQETKREFNKPSISNKFLDRIKKPTIDTVEIEQTIAKIFHRRK